MHRRTLLTGSAGLAAALGLGAAACAPPPQTQLVTGAPVIDDAAALIIDGEQIADQALWRAAQDEGGLILYSGYVENSEKEVIKAFTADTGLAVSLVRLVPNRLLERVLSEQGAGKLRADLIRTSDPAGVAKMAAAGAFGRHRVPGIDDLGADVVFDDGRYYRTFDPAFTFAYNTALVPPGQEPRGWQDLLHPRWRGKLGITQAGAGGSSLSLLRFQLDVLGEDYLRALAAQQPRIFDSSGAMQESLARGELHAATAVISSVNVAAASNAPVRFVVAPEGFALYDYFLGVSASPVNSAAAKVFCNWNLSRRAGDVFGQIGEYPAIAASAPPRVLGIDLPSIASGIPYRPLPADLAANREADQALFNKIFGYLA